MDNHLRKLFDREKLEVRTVSRAGVTQFVWNNERYGDEAEVDQDIVRNLLRRYPHAEAMRRAVAALERGETYISPYGISETDTRKAAKFGPGEVLLGLIGAIVGGALVAGLELLLALVMHNLFDGFLRVTGIGFIVLPILGAIAGFYVGAIAWLDIVRWIRRGF